MGWSLGKITCTTGLLQASKDCQRFIGHIVLGRRRESLTSTHIGNEIVQHVTSSSRTNLLGRCTFSFTRISLTATGILGTFGGNAIGHLLATLFSQFLFLGQLLATNVVLLSLVKVFQEGVQVVEEGLRVGGRGLTKVLEHLLVVLLQLAVEANRFLEDFLRFVMEGRHYLDKLVTLLGRGSLNGIGHLRELTLELVEIRLGLRNALRAGGSNVREIV